MVTLMAYPTVSINVVVCNEMKFLPELLESIALQTFRDFSVLIIDNGSTDGVEGYLREHYPEVTLLRNARNLGFSTAHNQGIRYAIEHWGDNLEDRFVLVTNPDTIFTPTFLEKLVGAARANPNVGSVGGKLMRAFGENLSDEVFKETVRSQRFDSTGLCAHKNCTFTDRGAGEMDTGQYNQDELVFGISGALVLYRAQALESARFEDEFFDKDFFLYKEDVDLAWRLQHLGWDALYVADAVAYHYRGMYCPEKVGLWQKITNRRNKSTVRSYYSTRNHWLLLKKNLRVVDLIFFGLWVITYEIGRVIYVLLFESTGRRAVLDACKLAPTILKKRFSTFARAKRKGAEVRRWFR
jgi:GT2 family glycosyltransferase